MFVRWDNLAVDAEDGQRPLPNLPGAVVRTFEAPEALGIRFHEIHAKSALNKVHPAARMPFNWTVNPYRGCSHACSYCVSGDTPILMADGRARPIADVRVGDQIYGTIRSGAYRRYALTSVLDHWETVKQAYRVTLEDGTELVASGDHRFWTGRAKWKHVTGAMSGPRRRPYLTTNDKLVGTGRFAMPPPETPDYRQGYLCGIIRGDGHIGSYSYRRPGRTRDDQHRFRLALADLEALQRSRRYLAELSIATTEFLFHAAVGATRQITAIRTSARDQVEAIRRFVRWPTRPAPDWVKGFLAGIFDAEGSRSEALRISHKDSEVIE